VTTSIGSANKVIQALTEKFPQAQFKAIEQQRVGAVMGEEIKRSAIIASLLSLFGILILWRSVTNFTYAVRGGRPVIHDVFMTNWLLLHRQRAVSGREFNSTVVAAILTIIGFSTNDTIDDF